jgi:hypothetical protein
MEYRFEYLNRLVWILITCLLMGGKAMVWGVVVLGCASGISFSIDRNALQESITMRIMSD